MSVLTIYHNPRCSKSRQTLTIIEESGVEPIVVNYLETPPDEATLRMLAGRLQKRPKDFIRRGEQDFKDLGLKDKLEDDNAIFAAMASHPKLIERPIVVKGDTAVLGRPPENVKTLL